MNKLILSLALSTLMALASAAPSMGAIESRAEELAAVRALPALLNEEVHDEFGQFAFRYVTAEGIVVSERGRLVPNLEGDGYVLILEGEVSYTGDDGNVYVTKYTAGVDGVRMAGSHLPTTPAPIVPEEKL